VLLERAEPLALMSAALREAREGCGHAFAIGGEPGIGKTSLVEAFTHEHRRTARVAWGACEALATPRPLGAFLDIADELGGDLLLQEGAPPHERFRALLNTVRAADGPTVLIVEDAHWIDDASADGLKFLARRIARSPALLLITYRDGETPPGHPLQRAITDVPADHLSRIRLKGLSSAAVELLARERGRVAGDLHAITEGNPFLVTELLRGESSEPTQTLRETLLARLGRLDASARGLAEMVAVVPDCAERSLVDAAAADAGEALQQCVERHLLIADRSQVRFRHELARRVVESSLSEAKRRLLNARVLELLEQRGEGARALPQLVHHADAAGDAAAVSRYAGEAAREAAQRGAHRVAAAFYRTALRVASGSPPAQRAALLDALASEARWSSGLEEAMRANEQAFKLWQRAADTQAQGRNRLARYEMIDLARADRSELMTSGLAEAAVRLLEPHGASNELAMAYADLAYVEAMRGRDAHFDAARKEALAVAERQADEPTLARVLLRVSFYANLQYGNPNLADVERGLAIALHHREDHLAAQAYVDLTYLTTMLGRFDAARRAVHEGLAFNRQRDFDLQTTFLLAFQARLDLEKGDWRAVEATATAVLSQADLPAVAESFAALSLAVAYSRIGDPRAEGLYERSRQLVANKVPMPVGKLGNLIGWGTLCWHTGERERFLARTAELRSLIDTRFAPFSRGRAALWMQRLDTLDTIPDGLPPIHVKQLSGDWAGAAQEWQQLGCPFERAMALIDGDEAAQREAFAILESLGATATIKRCRERLVERGGRIPRGPRPKTRANPCGLTDREMEVLALLERGLSNADISKKLVRSARTIDHHVSAILGKLGASTRQEATYIARSTGLLANGQG